MSKTDSEQLKGILEEFDKETILKVLRDQEIGLEALEQPIIKYKEDFPDFDRGKKSNIGEKNVVEREAFLEQKPINRIIAPDVNFLPVHFLEEGAIVQKAVARVRVPGYWKGSGFLVSNSLFMTNNHVLPTKDLARIAKFEFNYQLDYQGNPIQIDTYDGDPDDFFHTDVSLDYTVVRLKPHWHYVLHPYYPSVRTAVSARSTEQMEDIPTTSSVAALRYPHLRKLRTHAGENWGHLILRDNLLSHDQRVSIIQHPRGRRKECCVHDNKITDIFTNAIHYTTDTENGSSGSAVFDNEWELIAIHHAAGTPDSSGGWLDNEGIRIDKIIDDLQSNLRGTPDEGVLTELGIP